jgi:hypothetical protein
LLGRAAEKALASNGACSAPICSWNRSPALVRRGGDVIPPVSGALAA